MNLKTSFLHEHIFRTNDTVEFKEDRFSANAVGILKINEHHQLTVQLECTHWDAKLYSDVRLDWQGGWSPKLNFKLSGFSNQKPVGYLYQTLYLNGKEFWNQNFGLKDTRLTGLKFDATWNLKTNFSFGSEYLISDHFLYLNDTSFPSSTGQTQIFKAHFGTLINFGILNFRPKVQYNYQTQDPLGMNGWNASAMLGLSTKLFKNKVQSEIAARCRFLDFKNKIRYNPILQLFYASPLSAGTVMPIDFIAHFNVKEFRFLLELENIDSFWTKRPFIVESYPLYDFFLKIGINWTFIN